MELLSNFDPKAMQTAVPSYPLSPRCCPVHDAYYAIVKVVPMEQSCQAKIPALKQSLGNHGTHLSSRRIAKCDEKTADIMGILPML